eukprot:11218590-Prorocentrum_lima.AAC.1
MTSSLVGSEMCIRDRVTIPLQKPTGPIWMVAIVCSVRGEPQNSGAAAVSYTHLTLPTICSV